MTAAEMITYFDLLYDVNGSSAVAGFVDTEKFGFINKAQEAVVTEYCSVGDWDKVRELFGFATYDLTLSTAYGMSAYVTEAIDTDYLYYITSRTQATRTAYPIVSSSEWFENIKIPLELTRQFEINSANQSIFYNPRIVDLKETIDVKQVDVVTFTGTDGNLVIDVAGNLQNVIFDTSIPVTLINYIDTYYADLLADGVSVGLNNDQLIFTAVTAGVPFASPVIIPAEGNINATVVNEVSVVNSVLSNMFLVLVDIKTTPTSFKLHYVKKPTDIADDADCALREELHRPIIEKAVQLAMITVADPRVMASLKRDK